MRRYEVDRPGPLVHVDTKQLARVPDGGGWKLKGRGPTTGLQKRTRVGYEHVHAAVDDHSRLARRGPRWLHDDNHHRAHTALGGRSPIDRINNLPGHYT